MKREDKEKKWIKWNLDNFYKRNEVQGISNDKVKFMD